MNNIIIDEAIVETIKKEVMEFVMSLRPQIKYTLENIFSAILYIGYNGDFIKDTCIKIEKDIVEKNIDLISINFYFSMIKYVSLNDENKSQINCILVTTMDTAHEKMMGIFVEEANILNEKYEDFSIIITPSDEGCEISFSARYEDK